MSKYIEYSGSEATTAPTLVTQGLSLEGRRGYRVILSAALGQTINNTSGTVDIYIWSNALGRWVLSPSFQFTVSTSGVRDFPSPGDYEPLCDGRVFAKVTGVTYSSGIGTVTIEGVDL